ncbi:sandman [Carabus blaptoides fortunei]
MYQFGKLKLNKNMVNTRRSNVGIIGLVVGYTIAGAFIFQAIEGHIAEEVNQEMLILRNQTAERLWNLMEANNMFNELQWKSNANIELENYTWIVAEAIKNGFDGSDEDDNPSKWSFPGAFLYSLTVITTIGYGNVSPKTAWGKVTTIVYAIVGMPLFLLYLSNIGDILARCFKWLYAKCCLCRWCPNVARRREERRRRREAEISLPADTTSSQTGSPNGWQRRHAMTPPIDHANNRPFPSVSSEEDGEDDESDAITNVSYEEEEYDPQTVTVPVTICLTIMVGYICGGALLFSKYEGWNYLDGSYFCFISLSTIGFGDIVPGVNTYYRQGFAMSFVFCSMYLMLGMALIAMCFNLMQEEVINKIRKMCDMTK